MMKIWKALALVATMATAGCSSDDSNKDEAMGELEAPMLMDVVPMEGALHVMWMNMQTDGESVEAERKTEATEFALGFSVPGSVDNKMDSAATENTTYTYRLRCKKGDRFSPYSNELSANPFDM